MIRDMRVTPTPVDLNVISEPGMFTGWGLTIQLEDAIHCMKVNRSDEPRKIAQQLRMLADKIDA